MQYGSLGLLVLVDGLVAIGFSNVPDTNWQADPANTSLIVNEVDSGDLYLDDWLVGDSTTRLLDSSGNGNHAFFMPGTYVVDNPEFPIPVPYGKRWFFSSLNAFGVASNESIGYPKQQVIPDRSNWKATLKVYFTGAQADVTYPFEYYRNNPPNDFAWLGFGYQQVGGPDPDLLVLDIAYSAGGSSFSYSTPIAVTPGPQEHIFEYEYRDQVLNIKFDGLDLAGANGLHDLSAFDVDSVLDNYVQNSSSDAAILVDGLEFSTFVFIPDVPRKPDVSLFLRKNNRTILGWKSVAHSESGQPLEIIAYRLYRSTNPNSESFGLIEEISAQNLSGLIQTIFSESIAGLYFYGVSALSEGGEGAMTVVQAVSGFGEPDALK